MKDKPLKVALVGTYTNKGPGGPAVHIRNLISEMSTHEKIDIHILSKNIKDKQIKSGNITIHLLKFFKGYFFGELIHALKIHKKNVDINPRIVHYQGVSPYPLFCTKRTWLITIHGLFSLEVPFRFKGWKYIKDGLPRILFEKIVLSKAKNIIAVSSYIKINIESKYKNKNIIVIPNGIDDDFFTIKYKEKLNRLLFVGNIEPRKGVFELIQAIKIISKCIPSIKLVLIGKKTNVKYFKKITSFIINEKLTSNIIYKGVIPKKTLLKEYQCSSIFILPSKIEPFGIVLLEAMASGKPIVATKVGGIPYVVQDKETGFLVKDGDINDLADKILLLLNDKDLRHKMGKNGQKTAMKYHWKTITQKTISFYYNILGDIKC